MSLHFCFLSRGSYRSWSSKVDFPNNLLLNFVFFYYLLLGLTFNFLISFVSDCTLYCLKIRNPLTIKRDMTFTFFFEPDTNWGRASSIKLSSGNEIKPQVKFLIMGYWILKGWFVRALSHTSCSFHPKSSILAHFVNHTKNMQYKVWNFWKNSHVHWPLLL